MSWLQAKWHRMSELLYSLALMFVLVACAYTDSLASRLILAVGATIYPSYIMIRGDLSETLCNLSDCRSSPQLSDRLGAPGIYAQPSGHLLILRPTQQYELCNATNCITGSWFERKIPPSNDPYPVYPEMRKTIILKNIFKTPLGLQLEFDQAYDLYNRANEPRTAKTLLEFRSSDFYTDAMVGERMGRQVGTQFDMISGVGYRYDDYTMLGLYYGYRKYDRDNVIVKFASF
jgi:hypothetical protein